MPKFNYIAHSANQAEQPGSIEAADAQAARRQLERDGLRVLQLAPELDPELASGLPALSAANALDLTAQIAELAKAGLPLAAGLRAMQAELPWGRFSLVVQTLASRLESGAPADAVLAAAASRLPSHVRGMLAAGIHSGRLAEVLQECLELQQMQADLRRRIWSAIAYPLAVLAITAGWMAFVFGLIVPPMAKIYEDFEVELPSSTVALLWLAGPGFQILMATCCATALAVIGLWVWWRTYPVSWLLAKVPLVGPLWRSGNLAVFCRLLAVMLEQSIPLPAALRLTADGLQDAVLKAACLEAADRVEAGQSLSESLAPVDVFPHTLTLIVRWGERLSVQSEALRSAADLFRGRTALRADLLAAVFPPMVLVAVGFATLWSVFAMFLPLVKLISSLT